MPLTARSLIGIDALRALSGGRIEPSRDSAPSNVDGPPLPGIDALIDELATSGHGAVLVMGKGGVGKTTIAAAIATGLAHRGHDVHLSTTDPAGRVAEVIADAGGGRLTMSRSGHTLRLLDLTGSYHRQIMRDAADIHGRITTPLMRLQDPTYSRVLVVTTPEVAPSLRPPRSTTI